MSEAPSYTVRALAESCGGRLADPARGDTVIRRVAFVQDADSDAVTWIAEQKYARELSSSRAAAVIGTEVLLAGDRRGIIVDDAELAIAKVLDLFLIPNEQPPAGVHSSAVVHSKARLGPNVAIGALAVVHAGAEIGEGTVIHEGVSVGKDVRIGRGTVIYDRCVVYDRCEIGNNVIIHAGVVIGADGFGYIFRDGKHLKIAQIGTVVVEDDVEVGANTCIDRAKVGATRIGRGSKIDNLVMIAHNVRIGPLCVLAGQCGLAGSVCLGTGVVFGGAAGISHGVCVGDGARAAGRSFIIGDVGDGKVVLGSPARDHRTTLRNQALVRRLPKLLERIAQLEQRVADLEAAADH